MAAAPDSSLTALSTCELCGGTGWTYTDPQKRTVVPCKCQAAAQARERLIKSGLQGVIESKTFGTFQARYPWQHNAMDTVMAWTNSILQGGRAWLYMGGAVGSGKTHLCTAACGELLREGRAIRYMLWPQESRRLRACVTDAEEFDRQAGGFIGAAVLYIDDLFKQPRGEVSSAASPAEFRAAFEVLDARYRENKPTIISTEWMIDELLAMDEGTASRIYERSKGYTVCIGREKGRNYRLEGGKDEKQYTTGG